MADENKVEQRVVFQCDACGSLMGKIDGIALTSLHEEHLFFTCPGCGRERSITAPLADIWRLCPRVATPQIVTLSESAVEPKPLSFTSFDRKLLGVAHVSTE